jgi:hypothetical protein
MDVDCRFRDARMNGSEMPRLPRSGLDGRRIFAAGQRVKIAGGPLRDLSGVIEGGIEGDQVLINANESLPGVCIRISSALLENLDS